MLPANIVSIYGVPVALHPYHLDKSPFNINGL